MIADLGDPRRVRVLHDAAHDTRWLPASQVLCNTWLARDLRLTEILMIECFSDHDVVLPLRNHDLLVGEQ